MSLILPLAPLLVAAIVGAAVDVSSLSQGETFCNACGSPLREVRVGCGRPPSPGSGMAAVGQISLRLHYHGLPCGKRKQGGGWCSSILRSVRFFDASGFHREFFSHSPGYSAYGYHRCCPLLRCATHKKHMARDVGRSFGNLAFSLNLVKGMVSR